jgi:dehydrogenase/reductase SDR family protein 4
LAKEGAKVVISSRKQSKVDKAVELLKNENLECHGLVCHVGKTDDRTKLIDEVFDYFTCLKFSISKFN